MKKTKNEKKQNNGITLISLVITIIVMLILVGVSINLAVNGGLFEYAGNAVGDTKNAINKDGELGTGSIIEKYLYNISDEVAKLPTYSEELLDEETKVLTTNAKYISGNQVAVIPKGFKIIPGINETTTIADGLVIQDAKGNEFVWIPVEVTESDTKTKIASFYRSNWTSTGRGTTKYTAESGSSYNEPLTSGGYTSEDTDYNDMLKSVYTYEGFYIGRYEAGTENPRTSSTIGTTEDWVVQRDKYPYIYVGWGAEMYDYEGDLNTYGEGALYLCKNFYTKTDNVGVTSTLCYGVMWDAMLDFIIKDSSYSVTNSTTWGNYNNNTGDTWKITRATAKWTTNPSSDTEWTTVGKTAKEKTTSESILLTTGANDNFSAKNIYDVAGNVYEWTNEAYSTDNRVFRGGSYVSSGDNIPASTRYQNHPSYHYYRVGFRPTLYITNND